MYSRNWENMTGIELEGIGAVMGEGLNTRLDKGKFVDMGEFSLGSGLNSKGTWNLS